MAVNTDTSPIPFARAAAVPPPLPPSLLPYTLIPDPSPRFAPRIGLFLVGVLVAAITTTLALVVLNHLGHGISIASVLARLVSLGLVFSPLLLGRLAERRLRTNAVTFGAMFPLVLGAILVVPAAILM